MYVYVCTHIAHCVYAMWVFVSESIFCIDLYKYFRIVFNCWENET